MPPFIETLPNGTAVFTSATHRFGTDALLLSGFCEIKKKWSICDLGAGCGILVLSLIDKGLEGRAVAVEINRQAISLIKNAIKENNLTQLEALETDLRLYRSSNLFDLVVSNPPYFTTGPVSLNPARAAARHDIHCNLPELCKSAFRLLKDKGKFCLCFPANRLAELFYQLQNNQLIPKRMQFIRKSPKDEPWLVLVDARKHAGQGLSVLPDQILTSSKLMVY